MAEEALPRRARLLSLVVPCLLVVIAVTQLATALNGSLTPWRGGGFGMFSTLDSHDIRFLRVSAKTAGGQEVALDARSLHAAGGDLGVSAAVARARPTPRNLTALVQTIEETKVVVIDGVATPATQTDDQPDATGADRQRVSVRRLTVWRLSFDRDADVATPHEVGVYRAAR